MFAKKIVVAYNDTDLSNDVLEYVKEILKLSNEIDLDIIYSYEGPPEALSPMQKNFDVGAPEMLRYADQIILKAKTKFGDLPNKVEGFIYNEGAASAVLDHADEHHSDLIVIGNRGFTGLREYVSSVSRTVQSKAKIPVLIFPKYAAEHEENEGK
ncbi:universal stress protein [Kurthia sibirica]|nr:universal stress protein [Kurthia sibirica]GEK34967.1 hypothetical protein KSI01_25000 [Kurthia sibirica]